MAVATGRTIASMNGTRPRVLAIVGLVFAVFGALTAALAALLGPHSLSGGYLAVTAATVVFRVSALVGGVGVGVALLFDRAWGAVVMLCAATFYLGYMGGYFFAQSLGLWYPA